jgi:hypothetical protein
MPIPDPEARLKDLSKLVAEACAALLADGHQPIELAVDEPGVGGLLVLQPRELFLVDEGFFYVSPDDGDARTARAPYMVGLLEGSVGEPMPIRVDALKPTRGFRLSWQRFEELCQDPAVDVYRRLRFALFAYELAMLEAENRAYRKHMTDFYAPDTASLLPGPYEADDVDMVALLMETDDRCWAKRKLPRGVWRPPGLRNNYLIVMAHFSNVTCKHPKARGVTFDYRETTVFIPAVAWVRPGAYSPILFPDNAMAITLGREIYGFPKRFGRTKLDVKGGYAELEVDDELQFWCEWKGAETVPTERYVDRFVERAYGDTWVADKVGNVAGRWFQRLFAVDRRNTWPAMSVFVRKQLPDVALPCERDLVYEFDKLVRVPFDVSDVKHCELLDMSPDDFHPGPHASFLPESRLLLAGRATMDMGFGVRQELHNFLGPLDYAKLAGRQAKRTAQRSVSRAHGIGQLLWDEGKVAAGKLVGS